MIANRGLTFLNFNCIFLLNRKTIDMNGNWNNLAVLRVVSEKNY